jgi:hypothetical protein
MLRLDAPMFGLLIPASLSERRVSRHLEARRSTWHYGLHASTIQYNVAGFYVAKLKKIAPSPGHIPLDNTKEASTPWSAVGDSSHDPHSLDGFGSFNEAEDLEWMQRAK